GVTAADTLALVRGALRLPQFVLLHLRALLHGDEVAHLQHHAANRAVVVVLHGLAQLSQTERADRALLVHLLVNAAALPGDFDLRHRHASGSGCRRTDSRRRWSSARGSRSSDSPWIVAFTTLIALDEPSD